MMREVLAPAGAFCSGLLLGLMFYGGLWWTIERARRPAASILTFPVSLLLRTGVAMLGIYFIGRNGAIALACCLLGFLLARFGVAAALRRQPPATPVER